MSITMEEFFEPAYTVDFADELTRKRIRSVKPGASVKVKVHLSSAPAESGLEAIGTRSEDGKRFDIRLTVGDRFQDISYNYEDVVTLADSHGKP